MLLGFVGWRETTSPGAGRLSFSLSFCFALFAWGVGVGTFFRKSEKKACDPYPGVGCSSTGLKGLLRSPGLLAPLSWGFQETVKVAHGFSSITQEC